MKQLQTMRVHERNLISYQSGYDYVDILGVAPETIVATARLVAYDSNPNVHALVKARDGYLSAQYVYGPFGEVIRQTGPMAKINPFRFSTKYIDEETELVYYGYRYYSPTLGRWLSRDPIEEKGEENLYGFVGNNSVNAIDHLGLWEGIFVVNHYDVALHGEEARARNIPDGATVPGFSVRYVPERKSCSCPKDKIIIVQVISHNSNAVPNKNPH